MAVPTIGLYVFSLSPAIVNILPKNNHLPCPSPQGLGGQGGDTLGLVARDPWVQGAS
ncbi:MAG: hypothetical protein QXJ45_07920 [Thermoproteota archaeon]